MIPPIIPSAILTDIEGTTTSIAFVHDVLFPYARVRIADHAHQAGVAPILAQVREVAGDPAMSVQDCIDQLLAWQDADTKIAPLKVLQGMIWAQGYASGTLQGHVYADAVAGLRRWQAMGVTLAVYSSGSVSAQRLLFGHSDHGDLAPLFSAWFDTAVGGKRDVASYRAIAAALHLPPADILFLSDVAQELEAARQAGFQVTLLARDGLPADTAFPLATTFDTILPQDTQTP